MRYGDTGLRIYSEFSRRKITANVQYHRYFRILYLQDGMRNCTKSNMTRVDRDAMQQLRFTEIPIVRCIPMSRERIYIKTVSQGVCISGTMFLDHANSLP